MLAEAIRDFLKRTIQAIRPFMSSEDIRKGQRWPSEIGDRLGRAQYCILCLTAANLKSPWLLYEAGAISREKTAGVSAVLLDVEPSEVEWPLAQFQHTRLNHTDISKLLKELNDRLQDKLEDNVLSDVITQYWPELEKRIENARDAGKDSKPPPTKSAQEKMLEELLSTSRENARLLADLARTPRFRRAKFKGQFEDTTINSIARVGDNNPRVLNEMLNYALENNDPVTMTDMARVLRIMAKETESKGKVKI